MNVSKILIYAEQENALISPVAYELLTKARTLFGEKAQIAFVMVGSAISVAVEELKLSGADMVYYMDDERLALYHPVYYCEAILASVKRFDPDVLLIGATAQGEELAPTLGCRLKTGVAAHCVDLKMKDNMFKQMVPAFGGKVIGEIYILKHRPHIASVKPGILSAQPQHVHTCQTEVLPESIFPNTEKSGFKALRFEQQHFEGIPVEQAEIIVCGGYGVGNAENWNDLEKLAQRLGAAVGCTRPVIDNGWVKTERGMIGTSGKSVHPKVYLGFGISGAAHQLCGMKDSGLVISINIDAKAEMFAASDYMAVADAHTVIREMLAQLN